MRLLLSLTARALLSVARSIQQHQYGGKRPTCLHALRKHAPSMFELAFAVLLQEPGP